MKRRPIHYGLCVCLYFAFVVTYTGSFAQQAAIDSLRKELVVKNLPVERKLELLDALVFNHWELDASKGIAYGHKGIALAKEHNQKKWLSVIYSHTAMCFYFLSQYDSAHIYLDHALAPAKELDTKVPLANVYMNKGSIYKMQNKYTEGLSDYFQALKLFEEEKHEKGEGMALGNIAQIYLLLRNFKQAEKYLKKAEAIAIKLDDKEDLGSVSLALTNIYLQTDLSKAIRYATSAADIYHQLGNKYAEAISLSILGKCHQDNKDYQKAALFTEKGLDLAKQVGYPNLLAQLYIKMSNVRYHQGQYQESNQLAAEGLKNDTANMEIKHNALFNYIRNYMFLGELNKAENYIDQYAASIQHFANKEYQTNLSELEVQYETEKKELKIEALQKQRQLHKWLSIATTIIVLVVGALAFIRYRLAVSRRKLAEKESQRLEQEKQLVAVQATLDGESAERTRLARDLHDGLGSMLSAVKINLPQVNGNALLETVDVSRFQKAIGMLDDSIQELRRVAHHMMPQSLIRHGLKDALSDFCSAISIVKFHYFGKQERLQDKLEIMIYRCIHELVNNALKHAQASQINVQLLQEDTRISFTVQDDGKGFDQATTPEGMGLQNIRQRVDAFQGKMEIYSSDQGTEIHVEIKLTKQAQND